MKAQTALKIMIGLVSALMVLHFLILLKVIPYDITWGGKLKSDEEMYVFESVSIALNGILLLLLLLKGRFIGKVRSFKFINFILWVFLVLFSLNTIGNLLAETIFEKFFTIFTLAFVLLLLVILRKGERTNKA
jgi:hypothetical protein